MKERPDKRRHLRTNVRLPLRYRAPLTHPSPSRSTQAKDLSLGGLCFRTEEFVPLDTTLVLELRLRESARPVRSVARVAWARIMPSGHRYEIGSEFVDISLGEMKVLEEFFDDLPEGRG